MDKAPLGSSPIPSIGPPDLDRSRIGSCLGIAVLLIACCVQAAIAEGVMEGHEGIASHYPRDVGIETDPAVLFSEGFEEGSKERVFSRWEDAGPAERISLRRDVPQA